MKIYNMLHGLDTEIKTELSEVSRLFNNRTIRNSKEFKKTIDLNLFLLATNAIWPVLSKAKAVSYSGIITTLESFLYPHLLFSLKGMMLCETSKVFKVIIKTMRKLALIKDDFLVIKDRNLF